MAVEEFLTDEFIREQKLYLYETQVDPATGDYIDVIVQRNPEVIRQVLKQALTHHGLPLVRVEDGNYKSRNELYLVHEFTGFALDEPYLKRTLEIIYFLWGRRVHLETVKITDEEKQETIIYSYDSSSGHKSRK